VPIEDDQVELGETQVPFALQEPKAESLEVRDNLILAAPAQRAARIPLPVYLSGGSSPVVRTPGRPAKAVFAGLSRDAPMQPQGAHTTGAQREAWAISGHR
jgi:hypothetical protein